MGMDGWRILVWNMEDAQNGMEWNGMEDLKNGMEDRLPYSLTIFKLTTNYKVMP